MKKSILFIAVVLLGVSGLAASYFVFIKKQPTQQTSMELYQQALNGAVSAGTKEPSGSFDIDYGYTKFNGEYTGYISGDNRRLRGDMENKINTEGIELFMDTEIIIIDENDKSKEYVRYKSVTPFFYRPRSGNLYKQPKPQDMVDYYAPAINKWVKLDDESKSDKLTNNEEVREDATLDLIGIFAPISSLNEDDKRIFLSTIDKYNLFEVGEDVKWIIDTRLPFEGIEARILEVSVNKEVFMEFQKELSDALSEDSGFIMFETKDIDQLFGKKNKLSAEVYLDPSTATIVGVYLHIYLDSPIKDTSSQKGYDEIVASVLIDYDRDLAINAPESFITEQEMDALLSQ